MTTITFPDWLLIVCVIYYGIARYEKIMQGFDVFKRDWNRSFKWFRK